MSETTDLPRVEITEWTRRAAILNDRHGGLIPADCLSAEDIETLERSAAICTFIAAVVDGRPGFDVLKERMTATATVLLLTARDLRHDENWPARAPEEEAR